MYDALPHGTRIWDYLFNNLLSLAVLTHLGSRVGDISFDSRHGRAYQAQTLGDLRIRLRSPDEPTFSSLEVEVSLTFYKGNATGQSFPIRHVIYPLQREESTLICFVHLLFINLYRREKLTRPLEAILLEASRTESLAMTHPSRRRR